jgi:hypothetical protein
MSSAMKIQVTREDIEQGRRRDPNNCAVAVALRRAGVSHFGVTGMVVSFAGSTVVLLPVTVQEWIMDFDWGVKMDPMEFDLILPSTVDMAPRCDRESNGTGVSRLNPTRRRPAAQPEFAPDASECHLRCRSRTAGVRGFRRPLELAEV